MVAPAPGGDNGATRQNPCRTTLPHPWRLRRAFAATAVVLGLLAATADPRAASAASPYERGPNPTAASIAATTGPFAIASVTVPRGNGFGSTERAYIQVTGAGHNYIGQPSTILARTMIPWLKIFVDDDTRYSRFLCPSTNMAGIRQYRNSCPLI